MFTGIVSGRGRVVSLVKGASGARLVVAPDARWGALARGESVAVSGVCLTALRPGPRLAADLSAETLGRTTLGALRAGDRVNLERALEWGDRLSGHFVLGHVDGVARIAAVRSRGRSRVYRIAAPRELRPFVVEKGSVALDGISLTVARVGRGAVFDVMVIPETLRRTTLSLRRAGDGVNFEADVFARYGRAAALSRLRRARRRARGR